MHLLKAFNDRRKVKSVSSPVKQAGANDWDKPYVHPVGPSNKELMARKGPKTPKGNYESVNSQGSSSSVVSTPVADPNKYRLTSYGDD